MASSVREKTILDRQLNGLDPDGSAKPALLDFSTRSDKLILFASVVCAILGGILNPLISVIYGQTVGVFQHAISSSPAPPASTTRNQLVTYTLYWVYLSIAIFVLIYIATVGFYYIGEHTTRSLRKAYLKAVIRQNIAYFDTHEPGQVSSRIMSDMTHVQEGLTSKVSIALTAMATFGASFVISFVVHWKTALILCPTFFIMTAIGYTSGLKVVKLHKEAGSAREQASGLAQESISSVRHVYALGIQHYLVEKYESILKVAGRLNRKALYIIAVVIAWSNSMPILIHGLTFWAGSIFLVQGTITVAQITTLALVAVIGAFAIVRIAPSAQALASTVSSASVILDEMSRRSPQDPFDEAGETVENFQGTVEIRGISLVYPSRPGAQVMKDVSFTCPAKKTTAIVGSSGSGKSSIINLLERFYEPTGGQILVDGIDIHSLNLRWLRSQIGLVSQNPVLFDTTIRENIRYGAVSLSSHPTSEEALTEQIIAAAKMANAHDFISALPDGYETRVGEDATQLSGGQKQRITIARALMRDPKILLLDEATSALDATSEAVVQSALNNAAQQRTTIVIAHRLSTIRHADNIVVISKGSVVERGTHDELIASNGHYARLVEAQKIASRAKTKESQHFSGDVISTVAAHDSSQLDPKIEHATNEKSPDATMMENGALDDCDVDAKKPTSWGLVKTLSLILRINKKEHLLLLIGLICSILAGLELPGRSIVFAKSLEVLSLDSSKYHTIRHEINTYAGILLALAFVVFFLWIGVGIAFAIATDRLSQGARNGCFRSIMTQSIAFFDQKPHATGALVSILTSATDSLIGLGGPVVGGTLTFLTTIFGGIFLSIAIGWKLALVCTATIPLVVVCGWVRLQMLAIFDSHTRQHGIDAASYAAKVVKSVGTVASLSLEEFVLERFYAASQSVVYLASALAFWYGGTLLIDSEYSLFQIYVCYSALVSGAQIAGSIFAFAPDASKAMHAGWEIDTLLQAHKDNHNTRQVEQEAVTNITVDVKGVSSSSHIELRNVSFAYPSRKSRLALDTFNLKVNKGQFVALVGSSGCGKSTTLSLIERFYSPNSGSVYFNGQEVSTLDLDSYRKCISLVSQDSVLYSASIRENIAMGRPGEQVSDETIWEVCRQANIADFIASLEDGLSTFVGAGGCMLSGGQKQRIEIARALLRDPEVLLIDEATSALDTESEVLVQQALETASSQRTTIAVAHRLSTVKKADCIYVLDQGKVVESGTHDELVQIKGAYWDLLQLQSLE